MRVSLVSARDLAVARGGAGVAQHLETIMDGNGRTTTYTRDTLGQVSGVECPDASSETVSYDANGTAVETVHNSIGLPIYRTRDGAAGVEGATFEQIGYDTLLRPATLQSAAAVRRRLNRGIGTRTGAPFLTADKALGSVMKPMGAVVRSW